MCLHHITIHHRSLPLQVLCPSLFPHLSYATSGDPLCPFKTSIAPIYSTCMKILLSRPNIEKWKLNQQLFQLLDGLSVECRKFGDVLASKVRIISKDIKDARYSKSS
ncbi:hypothetical protein YC2023_016980 [Brassica napus]